MHSSTSSSEASTGRRWGRTWALALALVLLPLGAWEAWWRAQGFRPSISSDVGLWAVERARAVAGDGRNVVILGSSRVKTGVVPGALAETTGWETPIQLAINFSSPVLALEHLADDPGFRGLAIVDVAPIILFNGFWPLRNMVGAYLEHYETAAWSEWLDARLSALVESLFVFRLPELSVRHLPASLRKGELPAPQKFWDDRSRVTHIAGSAAALAPAANSGDGGAAPMDAAALDALVARLDAAVAKLRSRGASVVFLAMPTSGPMGATEARLFPRERYWDVFAERIDAPAILAADEPELARFVPPDGSHLTDEQAREFSRALGRVLVRRGIGDVAAVGAGGQASR